MKSYIYNRCQQHGSATWHSHPPTRDLLSVFWYCLGRTTFYRFSGAQNQVRWVRKKHKNRALFRSWRHLSLSRISGVDGQKFQKTAFDAQKRFWGIGLNYPPPFVTWRHVTSSDITYIIILHFISVRKFSDFFVTLAVFIYRGRFPRIVEFYPFCW